MENCLFEYTAGQGPRWYIGGVDAHNAKNWVIRGNTFRDIQNPGEGDEPSEHAVHFWSNSENTLVERNLIVDCDRGIGFGLGDRGHSGGTIRNNMIYHSGAGGVPDVGVGLENARDTEVYNNTIYFESDYPNAIEIRFAGTTGGFVRNTLTNRAVALRDGGDAARSDNVTDALAVWFVQASTGNLRLASAVPSVVDKAAAVIGLTDDFDGALRPAGAGYDIGAHEYGSVPAPSPTPVPSPTPEERSGGGGCSVGVSAAGVFRPCFFLLPGDHNVPKDEVTSAAERDIPRQNNAVGEFIRRIAHRTRQHDGKEGFECLKFVRRSPFFTITTSRGPRDFYERIMGFRTRTRSRDVPYLPGTGNELPRHRRTKRHGHCSAPRGRA